MPQSKLLILFHIHINHTQSNELSNIFLFNSVKNKSMLVTIPVQTIETTFITSDVPEYPNTLYIIYLCHNISIGHHSSFTVYHSTYSSYISYS